MAKRAINLIPLAIFVIVTIGLIYLAAASVGGPHSEVVSFTLKPIPGNPSAPSSQRQRSYEDSI